LRITGIGHHEHIYGVHQEINVVRDGVNMGSMRPEHYYDFKHQSMEDPVPSLRQLLPGDQITQICDYDTSNAPGDYVEFGDYTQQEMCYSVIYCKFACIFSYSFLLYLTIWITFRLSSPGK
jgi:hypothetical protein